MLLSGSEIAGYVKERQAKEVRRLKQALGIQPKLVILQTKNEPTINTYVRLKKSYGEDIGVEVDIVECNEKDLLAKVNQFNDDKSVHGAIVQLPIDHSSPLSEILDAIKPVKDVDGLGAKSKFGSASATAILWLLAGYNVELAGKKIVVVGQGRLVGKPLTKMLQAAGHYVQTADESTVDLRSMVLSAEILISATGSPRLIKNDWIKPKSVVVDAGTTSEAGKIIGDLEEAIYEREDIKVTPAKGGVGPLTVCALFDNLLQAAAMSQS